MKKSVFMSRVVGALVLAAMMLSVAGCGTQNNQTSQSAPDAAGSSGQVTNITFWHLWSGSEADQLQAIIDEFNNTHKNIHVDVLAGTTTTKQLTAVTGGDAFDVGYLIDYRISKLASVGALAQLDSYIQKAGLDSKNQVTGIWNLGNYGGKQFGIPYTMDSYMLFYNKKLFSEAGMANPPKTTSELAEYAKKLTKKDSNGEYTQVGFIPDYPSLDQLSMPFVFGANLYDYGTNKLTCDSQNDIDALKYELSFYRDPYEKDKILKFKSGFGKYQSPNNPFFQNQLAMDIEGEWYPTFIKQFAKDMDYGIAPMPYPDGHPELANGGLIQGGMLYIPNSSKNKDASFEFINWLISDEPMIKFCAGKGSLPTTYSALNSTQFSNQVPELKPFIEVAKGTVAKAVPPLPFAKEYLDELALQEQKVFEMTLSPEEAMKAVITKIQPLADEWVKNSK